jgi:hypothetical protein
MGILGHFRGVKIRKGIATFPHTGVELPLNFSFFLSAVPVIKINAYLLGLKYKRGLMRRKPPASLAFYPQPSGPWYNAWLAARMGGVEIVSDPEAADVVFVFDDKTASDTGETLSPALKTKAINHRINDISKTHVARVFKDVFGYSVEIDPLTYHGKAVEKSDANATHDGVVIMCPLSPEALKPGSVYQKLIDSTFDGSRPEDLRMAYVSGEIPVVFRKFKLPEKRFGTDYDHVDVWDADQAFTAEEQALLIKFCDAMGLDFGAVDVMRDKHDGRIYVVDVNKTCMPVLCLSQKSQRAAMRKIAAALLRLVERVKA